LTVKGHILRSASVITLITLISRICGYLRDQRVVLLLGTSSAADSFILAFRIPSLLRRMSGGGALGASFIPVFSRYLRERDRREAWVFAQRMFWDVAVVLAAVALLGFIFSKQVIRVFTLFGATHVQWGLAVSLNRIIFPCVLFLGLAGLATAILNSFHVFGLPASTSIFFNLAVIVLSLGAVYRPMMHWLPPSLRTPAVALAAGVLVGTMLQLATQIPALAKRGMNFRPAISFTDPGVRKVGRLTGPAVFGMGVYQINFFVDTIFATSSRMPQGSITSLYVADRVMELVLGSYAIALSTALLPAMSHQAAAGDYAEMKRTLGFSLRIVSFITIPAAVGLILLRGPIIQVLFQHGNFAVESTSLTAHALLFYSLGLPAYAGIKQVTAMYYSTQDTLTPARTGAYALGLNIALNAVFLLFFVRYLSNGSPALASSLAAYFNFGALFLILRRRYGLLGTRGLLISLSRIVFCAAGVAIACLAALRYVDFSAIHHILAQATALAAIIFGAAAVYFGLAVLLRCEELSEFLLLLRRPKPEPSVATGIGV
jgi:putative peptidoglycan lipid II flippase